MLQIYIAFGTQGNVLDIEAEVQCKTCHKKKWVAWDKRHAGADRIHVDHSLVRCRDCLVGKDFVYYTGHHRLK